MFSLISAHLTRVLLNLYKAAANDVGPVNAPCLPLIRKPYHTGLAVVVVAVMESVTIEPARGSVVSKRRVA